jgi:hypothetical protein
MPEESLRTIEGKITTHNPEKRNLSVRDRDNITEGFSWDPAQDKEFTRLKIGWWARITLEKRGNAWIAISQAKPQRQKNQQPAGDQQDKRAIMKSVLIKAWTSLWMQTNTPDTVTFEDARREIRKAVDEDLPWAMGEKEDKQIRPEDV